MKKYITTVRKLLSYLYLTPKAIVMSQWHTKGRVLIQLSAALPIKQEEKNTSNKIETSNKGKRKVWIPLSTRFLELNKYNYFSCLPCHIALYSEYHAAF